MARADIRVILGAPGTPHLVIEFKKLGGKTGARWQYCFDGISRFVEGKYAVGHAFGVMCGFHPGSLADEAVALADYIRQPERAAKLLCVANGTGDVITVPSSAAPAHARFDTVHNRPALASADPISLMHVLIPCVSTTPIASASRPPKVIAPRKSARKAKR